MALTLAGAEIGSLSWTTSQSITAELWGKLNGFPPSGDVSEAFAFANDLGSVSSPLCSVVGATPTPTTPEFYCLIPTSPTSTSSIYADNPSAFSSSMLSYWTHYAFVLDNDAGYARITIYLNGSRFGAATAAAMLPASPIIAQPRIAIQLEPGSVSQGGFLSMREVRTTWPPHGASTVRYWSRALTLSEIFDHWSRRVIYQGEQYPSNPSLLVNVPLTLGDLPIGVPVYPSNFTNDVTGTSFTDVGGGASAVFINQSPLEAFLCNPPAFLEIRGGASVLIDGGHICIGSTC
eukprot:tig00020553_g10673.t1